MHSTGILFHKFRRGTSTILGTIIFIGIMFTAVIPMLLVVNQADTLFEQSKYELEIRDDERSDEELYVYVYPQTGPTGLIVKVQNRGGLSVRVVSLWVNDNHTELDKPIAPMSGIVELQTVEWTPVENSSYFIMVTTDRGKMIAFDTPITWTPQGWEADIYSINVLISSLPGTTFKINVTGQDPIITEKYDPKFIIVPNEGAYTVQILRGIKVLYTEVVTISWPDTPVKWVFA